MVLGEMLSESGIEKTSIIRKNRRAEKVEFGNALNGLSGALGFMTSEIAAVMLVTAELPHGVKMMDDLFENREKGRRMTEIRATNAVVVEVS